jgi:hypothetical protein
MAKPVTGSEPSQAKPDSRSERLAAALRENLRRRKAQARGRATGGESPADPPARAEDTDESRNRKG